MSASPTESTPEPIYKAAVSVGAPVATVLSIVLGVASTLGVISSDQVETVTALGAQVTDNLPELVAAVTVIVGIVSGVLSSVMTAWHARKQVAPVDSDVFTVVPGEVADPLDH